MKTTVAHAIAVLVLLAAVIVVAVFLPLQESMGRFLESVGAMGIWGPVFLAGVYLVACVLFVPGMILTLGAGFLFGLARGTVVVSVGSTLGATAAFLIGRTLARGPIEKRVAAYPRFRAIDRALGRHAFKIVLLVRLSPIFPFNLLNYAFGLIRVPLRHYFFASWLGMLPGTLMYVYFGSVLKSLAEVVAGTTRGGTVQTGFFLAGLLMTVVATVVIARVAKRALDEATVLDPATHPPNTKAREANV